MHFHKQKCPPLNHIYKIGKYPIPTHDTHRDFGIMLQFDLSWAKHYDYIPSKAYRILGLLKRTFSMSNSVSIKRKSYVSLVRSQLSYCSQLRQLALIKDVKKLEQIQRRATKIILGTSHPLSDYKHRLITLILLPLMYYFEIADIMFTVKSIKNESDCFNILKYLRTRSSDKVTLKHVCCSTHQQQHFYFNHYGIDNHIYRHFISKSTRTVKTKIYELFWSHFIVNFYFDNTCTLHFSSPCGKCSKLILSHTNFFI